MLRISALNDSSCSEDDSQKIQQTKTKEAKEAEAFAAYNKALSHQQKGNTLHAEKLLRILFDHPLLKEASSLVDDENQTQTLNHPGLQLLYSIQKNLASILLQRGQLHEAMAAYIEAVKIDSSEVTVWFKMGQVARDLHNYPLAKVCFQQALQCNPNHWPSLDNAITVTYALEDYLMCLENISTALEKDYSYPKGLTLRNKILSEQPSLESVTAELFLYCDPGLLKVSVDPEEAKEYINEALKIRAKRRQLVVEHQEKEFQPLRFLKPLTPFTWKNVGEQLIDLYDYAVNSDPPKSLALEVDLRDYFFLDHMVFLGENVTQDKPSKLPAEAMEDCPRPSQPFVKKITLDLSENDANTAFQRAKEKAGGISSGPPQSLSIKDTAKESALMRRLQGDISHSDVPDIFSKMTSEDSQSDHINESVHDDLELDAMDMSDVPLLQEEDIDMAVLSLKDMRKGDFRPELLLKTNVEDMSDVRTLENVLSSVIDMEMQDLYPNHEVEPVSKGGVTASLSETGASQIEVDKLSIEGQYKLATAPLGVSKPLEASIIHTMDSSPQANPAIIQTCTSVADHIIELAAHNLQTQQANPSLRTYTSPSACSVPTQNPLQANLSLKTIISPHAHTTSTQSPQQTDPSLRTIISPQAHTTSAQSLQQTDPSLRTIISPQAHTTSAQNLQQTDPSLRTIISPQAHTTSAQNLQQTDPSLRTIISPHAHTTSAQSLQQTDPSLRTMISPHAHTTSAQSLQQTDPSLRTIISPQAHTTSAQSLQQTDPSFKANISPPPAHTTLTQSPRQTNSSLRTNISQPPAHTTSTHSPGQTNSSLRVNIPPPAHSSPLAAHVSTLNAQTIFPHTIQQSARTSTSVKTSLQDIASHSSSMQPSTHPAQVAQTKSPVSSTTSQLSSVPAVLNLLEQPLQCSSRLPSEYVHSPITTSLLSPNSSGSCPKPMSAYHNVFSSIEQSYTDSPLYRVTIGSQSGRKPELSPLKYTQSSSKPPQEGATLKGSMNLMLHKSSNLLDRINSEDLMVGIRSKPHGQLSTERSSHVLKTYQSQLSPLHSSPQPPTSGLAQSSSIHSYHSHEPVPSHSHIKSPLVAPSHSNLPSSQGESPLYMPRRYSSGREPYRDTITSFPVNPLSLDEAEAFLAERTTEKLTGHKQTSLKRFKPPPLSRSSSLPGYYTNAPEHTLLSYLSPPPQVGHGSISPFHLSGSQLSHNSTQQTLSLPLSLTNLIPSSLFLPCSLPISHPDITPHPLYSSLYSGHPLPHHLFPPSTLSPYLSTPRPQKYMEGYNHHLENMRQALRPTSQTILGIKNEKASKEPKVFKPSPPSSNMVHHSYHTPNHPTQSSPQHGQPQLQPPKQPQTITQLQNLAMLAQKVPSCEEIHPASRDHSYHQKRGLVFQAMIESMLTAAGSPSRPVSSQALLMSSKGREFEFGSSPSEASKKRAQGMTKAPGAGAKRGPKRKVDESGSDDWANAYKRRSTRSRNSRNRKEDKSIDYQNLMKKYFPQSLLHLEFDVDVEKNDDTSMEIDVNGGGEDDEAGKRNYVDLSSLENLATGEEEEIKTYIKKCLKGHGLLDMMFKFLLYLAKKYDLIWYDGIADIYMNIYIRLRKHLTVPTLICGDDDTFTPQGLREYSTVILAWCELSLSRAATDREARSYLLPSKPGQSDHSAADCLGTHHNQDMMFLLSLTGRDDALGSFRGEFCVRLYWLKARQHQLLIETLDAVECFEIVSELLEDVAREKGVPKNNVRITVPNISLDKVISLSEASRQLECLQRCKSLEDTQKLYDQAHYDQVVDNLISTFSNKNLNSKALSQRERPTQLVLLVNSLYNIKQKSECLQWAEVSLREAILHYKRVPTLQLRQDWAATLISLFTCIDRLMDEDDTIFKSLKRKNLVRLAHSLVAVNEISLDVADSVTDMPIGSLLPWKILYRVLRFEEMSRDPNKQKSQNQEPLQREDEKDNQDEKDLSPSILMLREAHEYLGRHSWCTKDDGALLLFIMSVTQREMEGKNEDDLEELTSIFEQCVFCLYGHPNKRGRARHLSDHNSTPVQLTWERSGLIFCHFATQSVPEFDSYRTSTVTADVENLLRRIFALVPDKINPGQSLSVITDYIEGISSSFPVPPVMSIDKDIDPLNISDLLYYLLGDFYFKSKEPAKAVRFYQLDLVLNSSRLDSWAGLALARMSQIEQKLNSTELKIEKPIHKNSDGALRCFRRAVDLETSSCKLWLEYGSLAYQLHSHASRQIKCQDMFAISEEVLQLAMSKCQDMLLVAKNCYLQASKCEGDDIEEGWLTFYMMGKVSEKQKEDPSIYLEYYKQAATCLHEERAVYPKKIQFVNPRPHLALEALEVFYRIQVCALKLVLSGHGDEHLPVLVSYVTSALDGQFARGEEKQQKTVVEYEREETFASGKRAPPPVLSRHQHVYHKNPVDHEYSRHKSTSESQSEGEDFRCVNQSKPVSRSLDLQPEGHISTNRLIMDSDVISDVGTESRLFVESHNSSRFTQPHNPYLMTSSNDEKTVGDGTILSQDSLKENVAATSVSVNDVHIQQVMDVEEVIGTGELMTADKDVSEGVENAVSDGCCLERAPVQEVRDRERAEKNDASTRDLCQSEAVRSDNDQLIDSSQDNNARGDYQMNSQDGSQDSVQIGESSEEDAAVFSCGNDADVDTDAMDVDEDVSCPTSQDSADTSLLSGHAFRHEQVGDNLKTPEVDEIIEVHAGEGVLDDLSVPLVGLSRQVTESFTPHPHNLDVVSDIMDFDSFEDNRNQSVELTERNLKTSETDNTNDFAALPKSDNDRPCISQVGGTAEGLPDRLINSCHDQTMKGDDIYENKELADRHITFEEITLDDEEKDVAHVSKDYKSEKFSSRVTNSQIDSNSVSSSGHEIKDAFLKNGMDATGDLKNVGKTRTEKSKSESDYEGEKWEMESQEKSSIQVAKLPQPINSDVFLKGNVTTTQSTISVPKISETHFLQSSQSCANNSSAVRESGGLGTLPPGGQERDKDTFPQNPASLKAELISKCRSGLEMCASRFSSHYKSLYRLAHLYYITKELDKARDILLGRNDWQEQSHMPAPGLFSERKQINFFQGLWKIPVEDIDRSGCFATHVHRSVRLLLDVLCDLGDLEMLKNLHLQLRRTPETGKKYLRDAERLVLAEEAYLKCVDVIQQDMDRSAHWSEEQREENLLRIYHVWVSGKGCKHVEKVTDALHRAFKIMMKGRTDVNRLTAGQAVSFCQQNFSKVLAPSTPTTTSATAQSRSGSQCGAEKAKDGPSTPIEKVKGGQVLFIERAQDGPVQSLGGPEMEKSCSQKIEPLHECMEHDDIVKTDIEINQQSTDFNTPGYGNDIMTTPGFSTANSATSGFSVTSPTAPNTANITTPEFSTASDTTHVFSATNTTTPVFSATCTSTPVFSTANTTTPVFSANRTSSVISAANATTPGFSASSITTPEFSAASPTPVLSAISPTTPGFSAANITTPVFSDISPTTTAPEISAASITTPVFSDISPTTTVSEISAANTSRPECNAVSTTTPESKTNSAMTSATTVSSTVNTLCVTSPDHSSIEIQDDDDSDVIIVSD